MSDICPTNFSLSLVTIQARSISHGPARSHDKLKFVGHFAQTG